MKAGFRLRITVAFLGVLFASLALTIFLNSRLLDRFYTQYKIGLIDDAYIMLESFSERPENRDILQKLNTFSENYNFNIILKNEKGILLSSTRDEEILVSRLDEYLEPGSHLIPVDSEYSTDLDTEEDYDLMVSGKGDEIWKFQILTLKESDRVTIVRAYDPVANAFYLEGYGRIGENSFILRTPYQSIQESIEFSNRMYIASGLFVGLIAAIVIYFLAARLTTPVRSLTRIAERMSHLDFSVRYEGQETDEIGVLGASVNRMSDELESKISELMTANLQLSNDLEVRRKIDEKREEFIAGVSHDLKTPIAIVQGYAEGLKEGVCSDEEERMAYYDIILDESRRMSDMVGKLLMLNEIESGGEQLVIEHFNLTDLSTGFYDAFRALAAERNVTLEFPKENFYVWADPGMMETAIRNILSNAWHYVADHGIIRMTFAEQDGWAEIQIYNSGSHIPEQDLSKIWEKFYRADKARSREYGGNGIGLAITKVIIEKHHGQVEARNEEVGVTFIIRLPNEYTQQEGVRK